MYGCYLFKHESGEFVAEWGDSWEFNEDKRNHWQVQEIFVQLVPRHDGNDKKLEGILRGFSKELNKRDCPVVKLRKEELDMFIIPKLDGRIRTTKHYSENTKNPIKAYTELWDGTCKRIHYYV